MIYFRRQDKKIHLYLWNSNGTLTESGELSEAQKGAVTAVSFSPNGDMLAAGDVSAQEAMHKANESIDSIRLSLERRQGSRL